MVISINATKAKQDLKELDAFLARVAPSTSIAVMRAVEDQVISASPVDTGRFRSSWEATIGGPRFGPVGTDEQQKQSKGTITFSRPAARTGRAVWGEDPDKVKGRRLGLYNSLPYAKELAEGYSNQAAPGWINAAVRIGVSRWRSYFNRLGFNRRRK